MKLDNPNKSEENYKGLIISLHNTVKKTWVGNNPSNQIEPEKVKGHYFSFTDGLIQGRITVIALFIYPSSIIKEGLTISFANDYFIKKVTPILNSDIRIIYEYTFNKMAEYIRENNFVDNNGVYLPIPEKDHPQELAHSYK